MLIQPRGSASDCSCVASPIKAHHMLGYLMARSRTASSTRVTMSYMDRRAKWNLKKSVKAAAIPCPYCLFRLWLRRLRPNSPYRTALSLIFMRPKTLKRWPYARLLHNSSLHFTPPLPISGAEFQNLTTFSSSSQLS